MADDVIPTLYIKELRTTKFGMAGKSAQAKTSDAKEGTLNVYSGGGNGLNGAGDVQALVELVIEMRAALVANGIMKGSA